jgi:RND superfamily putative drug exporter
MLGIGLPVAVPIDATVVRGILVPATMTLLGDRCWYRRAGCPGCPDGRCTPQPTAPARPAAPNKRCTPSHLSSRRPTYPQRS